MVLLILQPSIFPAFIAAMVLCSCDVRDGWPLHREEKSVLLCSFPSLTHRLSRVMHCAYFKYWCSHLQPKCHQSHHLCCRPTIPFLSLSPPRTYFRSHESYTHTLILYAYRHGLRPSQSSAQPYHDYSLYIPPPPPPLSPGFSPHSLYHHDLVWHMRAINTHR